MRLWFIRSRVRVAAGPFFSNEWKHFLSKLWDYRSYAYFLSAYVPMHGISSEHLLIHFFALLTIIEIRTVVCKFTNFDFV